MKRHAICNEDGSILVIAIVLMAVLLAVGLSSFAFVDTGQKRGKEQRVRETSLNLTEGVLYSQGFALAQTWPGTAAAGATIPDCTSATVQALCPNPNNLAAGNSSSPAAANFTNTDAKAANVSWTTHIRDNGGPLADAFQYPQLDAVQSGTNVKTGAAYTCPTPCKWDANGDLKLWVQARAVINGQPRNVVALLKREQFSEPFPRNGVTAGSLETSNSGNKTIIDSTGSQVVVRCPESSSTCTQYIDPKDQVLPSTIVHDSGTPAAMTSAQIARFMSAAKSASTYYTSCPATLTGTVVFIDLPSSATECQDSNNAVYNSPTSPGIVIMPRGTLQMKGTFYGLIYMVNEQNSANVVLTLASNSQVFGGVAIDGTGRLYVGQASNNRPTIIFDPNAANGLATYGTTGLVQNTWRELPAG
jgi:type II secretory pathway pseudopilin PulG